jgi:hypothetical protein
LPIFIRAGSSSFARLKGDGGRNSSFPLHKGVNQRASLVVLSLREEESRPCGHFF